ncbi:heat-inducible transcriptional repressor HrcA [Raoultibacter phocaeensis]|uniref:heat-inducible transcriptional repressor HrcA n=1 Tax=Raoultibacter phocaeensis TaxID=2479841 RepID=UPI00111819BE|nr:heat-inducible transcriptional repressor HrcA [Raoultibacter phocaeensis]
MLSDRRQRVLSALIEEYVARALPVGSRTLVERYKLGVSPATVRNELSVLEDAGYIIQPHTSAGRIPTDVGYRAFVDDLLESGLATGQLPHSDTIEELKKSASELDDLIERTSVALTRLTDCLSIVLAPSVLALHIRQISLVSLTRHRALIVLVTEDGQVLNRSIDFADPVESDDLAAVQNLLNDVFAGKSITEVRDRIDLEAAEALNDPLVRIVLDEVMYCLQESDTGRAHRIGVSTLLKQPEFSHSQTLLPIMQILEDDAVLLHVFDDAAADSGPLVRIGRENNDEALSGVSVVATQYGRGDAAGVVAVIGPTRMDYSKVIQAVRLAQSVLQDGSR